MLKNKAAIFQIESSNYFALVPILLLNILLVWIWHHYNQSIPQSDAIAYLSDTFYRYHEFFNHGFLSGIIGLYTDRGWRPQIFPIFGVPFLILFGNNPFNAVIGVSLFFSSILLGYLYFILRISLTPLYAAITAFFLSTCSLIFQYNLIFFSEISYMPLVIAAFYHLLRSDFFSDKKHSMLCGFFIGFITFIRPAESVMFLSIALLPFIVIGLKRKNLDFNSLFTSLNIVITVIVLLFYFTYILPITKIKYLFGLMLAFYAIKKFHNSYYETQKPFVIFTFTAFSAIFIYWLPSVASLMEWTIAASVGEVVKSLGVQGKSFTTFFIDIKNFWIFILLPLLLPIPLMLFPRNRKTINYNNITLLFTSLISLLALCISYKYAVNDGQIGRRSLGMGLLLGVSIASLLLNSNVKYKTPFLVIISLGLFLNITSILNLTIKSRDNNASHALAKITRNYPEFLNRYYSNYIPQPNSRPDPAILLANIISKNICKYDSVNCLNHYRSFFLVEPIRGSGSADVVDPFSLGFASNQILGNESKFHLGAVFVPGEIDIYKFMKEKNVNFVMVQDHSGIRENDLNKEELKDHFYYQFVTNLIKTHRAGDDFKKLQLVDVIKIYDSEVLVFRNPELPLN